MQREKSGKLGTKQVPKCCVLPSEWVGFQTSGVFLVSLGNDIKDRGEKKETRKFFVWSNEKSKVPQKKGKRNLCGRLKKGGKTACQKKTDDRRVGKQ